MLEFRLYDFKKIDLIFIYMFDKTLINLSSIHVLIG